MSVSSFLRYSWPRPTICVCVNPEAVSHLFNASTPPIFCTIRSVAVLSLVITISVIRSR